MAQRNPPLLSKPPFATDEPDSANPVREPQRRYRQNLSPADANTRTSAYDVYVAVAIAFFYPRFHLMRLPSFSTATTIT